MTGRRELLLKKTVRIREARESRDRERMIFDLESSEDFSVAGESVYGPNGILGNAVATITGASIKIDYSNVHTPRINDEQVVLREYIRENMDYVDLQEVNLEKRRRELTNQIQSFQSILDKL